MSISISLHVLDDILRQAEEAYPHESCGVLVGREEQSGANAAYFLSCDNIHGHNRSRRFLIDPMVYQEAEDRADAEGLAIVSIVHSHPDHPDEPSEFDRQHAWPGLSYIIISVRQGRATGYRSWRLADDRQRFVAEAILSGGSHASPDKIQDTLPLAPLHRRAEPG